MGLGGLIPALGVFGPVLGNIFTALQTQALQEERSEERDLLLAKLDEFAQQFSSQLPGLSFGNTGFAPFGGGVFPDKSAAHTTFQEGFGPAGASGFGPDASGNAFNVPDIGSIESGILSGVGLDPSGTSSQGLFDQFVGNRFDQFDFDADRSRVNEGAKTSTGNLTGFLNQGLGDVNSAADTAIFGPEGLRSNLRGDFAGQEGLDLADPDQVFQNVLQTTQQSSAQTFNEGLRAGTDRFSSLGQLGFDPFDAGSSVGIGQNLNQQRLGDLAQGRLQAEGGRLSAQQDNSTKLQTLLDSNLLSNTNINAEIAGLERQRGTDLGALHGRFGDIFGGIEGGRLDLLAGIDAGRNDLLAGLQTEGTEFLGNLPGVAASVQGQRATTQGQSLSNALQLFGPQFATLEAELNAILGREDSLFDLGSIFESLEGIGTERVASDQPPLVQF